jgi:RNA-directed DNA polymerase
VSGSDLRAEGASVTGGPTDPYARWETIPWENVERHVSRMQTRIAKAARDGRVEVARKEQRRLVRSYDARLLAVRIVTTNRGGRTSGVDGSLWSAPKDKLDAAASLRQKGYRARPLRRVRIPKKGKRGQTRPLGIPTMRDRAMQALWALALDPVAEAAADKHSYGFRRGRSAQDAGQRLFQCLAQRTSARYVLEGDIKGCFDHISHEWLMENVPMDKRVLTQFLKAGFMEMGEWRETDEGTPQGGPISPILANIALDGMGRLLDERFTLTRRGTVNMTKAGRNKVHLVRYADDFVVTAATPQVAEEAKAMVAEFLAQRGLELSEEKTLVTHVEEGFDFLGWNFRKFGGKLLVKPSKRSVRSFLRETHACILRDSGSMGADELIRSLVPKVRGFANYHRHTCASKTFSHIDRVMHFQLMRWACRRHPGKHKGWVHERYFCTVGGNRYMFGTPQHFLPHMAWQHIVRHRILRADANPYLDREYFEERKRILRRNNSGSFRMPAVDIWR